MKLVILEPLGIAKEQLLQMAQQAVADKMDVIYYDTRAEDTETLIARSKDADVVVLSNFQYGKAVMEHCPNLKMICVAFTGVDHIDLTYCRAKNILVCNCSGYATIAVAELVFGLLITLYRNIIPCDQAVRTGGTKAGLVGFELAGKKFGVVGTGAIGTRTLALAQAFGCEVFAYSRTKRELPGVQYVELDTLLSTCDVISLHLPLNAETKGIIGKEQLAGMKKSAVLINTARGAVVDSVALAQALQEGTIAGAGVDVFEMEPPIPQDHPLFDAPHLVASPHVAFATQESMQKRGVIVFENIRKWLDHTPQNVID